MGFGTCSFSPASCLGGFIASHWAAAHNVAISPATKAALAKLGIHDFSGMAPRELFS